MKTTDTIALRVCLPFSWWRTRDAETQMTLIKPEKNGVPAYAAALFSMVPGEQRWVRLAFDRALFEAMADRFGTDAPVMELDEQTLAICAPVRVSAPFFGWVFQFGGRVRILAPEDVRERMALMLEAARAQE